VTRSGWSLGVLAGGQGARMGGAKASRPFHGRTLLEHAIARYAPDRTSALVSTRDAAEPVPAGATAVSDAEPGLGPLAGIAALLARAPEPWLLVVPVDLPLFPAGCGTAMADAAGDDEAVVLEWRGRIEPFPALIARTLAPRVRELLDQGLRRADAFHSNARCRVLSFDAAFPGRDAQTAFFNVNTPQDLARAEALLASEGL
jgi:molybdenum cofactor guanylyltransferase